jgi:plastocyanin
MRLGRPTFGLMILLVMIGGLFSAACGSSSSSSTATPPAANFTKVATSQGTAAAKTSTPAGAAQPNSVAIADFQFTPADITVKVGDTVTWTNNGPSAHTVTADDGSFDSGSLAQGKTFSHTFQTAGTFSYICTIHPFMKAQVVVQSGGSTANPGY